MSDTTSDVKQLKIETYNLVDFVMQIQQAVLDGYVVTDKSDEAPMCIGNCYHLIMSEKTNLDVNVLLDGWCDKVEGKLHETSTDIEVALASGIVEDVKIEDLQVAQKQVTIAATTTPKRGRK